MSGQKVSKYWQVPKRGAVEWFFMRLFFVFQRSDIFEGDQHLLNFGDAFFVCLGKYPGGMQAANVDHLIFATLNTQLDLFGYRILVMDGFI